MESRTSLVEVYFCRENVLSDLKWLLSKTGRTGPQEENLSMCGLRISGGNDSN